MSLKKSLFCIALITVFVIGCFSMVSMAYADMRLKVSHQFSTEDVRAKELHALGDRITEKTKGSIKFRYYPAQSLFKAKEQWDAMVIGSLDVCYLPPIYAAGKVPELEITNFPCLFSTMAEGLKWARKPIGKKLDAIMEKKGVKNLVWGWFDGAIGSTEKQIVLPADVEGTKLRAAGKYFEYMLREAGASITSMPSPELYHALATGVLNTCITSCGSYLSYRLYEELNYMNLPVERTIWFCAGNLMMSVKTWEKLSSEQQEIFLEASAWIQNDWLPTQLRTLVDKLDSECRKANVEVHPMSLEEFNEWKELAKKTSWKHFEENVDGGKELLEMAQEALE
jgi:TRAP-type C4-dicarboxylate transport system substrate-binding protein